MDTDRPQLALFDFDGTLTTHDTMFAFAKAVRGGPTFWLGLVAISPWLVAHRLGFLSAQAAKIIFLRAFFGGRSRAELETAGVAFADQLDQLLRPEAMARLEWHRVKGHEIFVVSASVDLWLRPWAERRGLGLLCTEAAYDGAVFRGELATPNCNGPEKERRVLERLDLERYGAVYAYGDSAGDVELLALADHSYFRTFS